ncbi:hypothetical protein HMPREF9515_02931 [Enterococcus faecalis TX0860]|nr:hypothetical protein HMPREF9515_02931 [Enterococcus faecalis TX0860]KDE15979.1 hypothetical protein HMPREF2097_02949 [Enterococcus faecalis 918]
MRIGIPIQNLYYYTIIQLKIVPFFIFQFLRKIHNEKISTKRNQF